MMILTYSSRDGYLARGVQVFGAMGGWEDGQDGALLTLHSERPARNSYGF